MSATESDETIQPLAQLPHSPVAFKPDVVFVGAVPLFGIVPFVGVVELSGPTSGAGEPLGEPGVAVPLMDVPSVPF